LNTEENGHASPDSPVPTISPPNEKNDKENSMENSKPEKSPTKNIFQIMMNSRNKSLGTNSPGKASPEPSNSQPGQSETKKKRAELLGEWAAQKGGLKRRLNEEAEEKYAEKVLDRRAKRLKRSLLQPGKTDSSSNVSQSEVVEVVNSEAASDTPKSNRRDRKKKVETVTSEGQNDKKPLENEEFLKKLNSPIKKKDSLLGYFAKVNKTPDPEIGRKSKKPLKIIESDDDEVVDELYIDVKAIVEVKKEEKLKSDVTEDEGTPKRSRRKKTKVEDCESLSDLQEVVVLECETPQLITPGGRPKRACTAKIVSYDIFDKSPSKNEKAGHKKTVSEKYYVFVNGPFHNVEKIDFVIVPIRYGLLVLLNF
jgi:hypothetical protein